MSEPLKKYKIALIGDSLANGGAEKVHAQLSVFFNNQDFDVFNLILINSISYSYTGNLLNLGEIKPYSSSIIRKYFRFKVLQKFIKKNNFDCVIDFRMRPNFLINYLLSKFIYPKNTIFCIHSGILDFYLPKSKFLSRLIYKNKKIVVVSDGIKNILLKRNISKYIQTIYNPLELKIIHELSNDEIPEKDFILIVGSMNSDIKQIDQFIRSYSRTILPKNNIKLIILGDGKLMEEYQNLVKSLNLSDLVVFKGNIKNPFCYYKNAKFLVSCSKNEGFPNVLIEALACSTPIIAFDCFSGPNEIIQNNVNGILVENQNFQKLEYAVNQLFLDDKLYQFCKKNALESVQNFSIAIIGEQWLEIIKI